MDLNHFNLSTDANYMKRVLSATVSASGIAMNSSRTIDIPHPVVGKQPKYSIAVSYDNTRWFTNGYLVNQRTDADALSGSGATDFHPYVISWTTTDNVVIYIYNNTDLNIANIWFKCVVYGDYAE